MTDIDSDFPFDSDVPPIQNLPTDTMPENIISKRLPDQNYTNGKMIHIMNRKVNECFKYLKRMGVKEILLEAC